VRRHRIVETYLVEALGLSWDQVHEEADRLEHAVSDLVLERMNAALGHPDRDPHGDPIPDAAGRTADHPDRSLREARPGIVVEIVRVSDRSPELLRYLHERGIVIGAGLRVISVSSAASVITMAIGGGGVVLALDLAAGL